MVKLSIDPDALEAVASSVSAAADSGPAAVVPSVDDCGSARVTDAFDESGEAFTTAFDAATSEAMQLSVGAVKAAQEYRASEERVVQGARGARR